MRARAARVKAARAKAAPTQVFPMRSTREPSTPPSPERRLRRIRSTPPRATTDAIVSSARHERRLGGIMPRRTLLVASTIACGAALGALAWAGTQQCNTACQSRMTDCILACDGRVPCELACKEKAVTCVNACSSDAGPSERAEPEPRIAPSAYAGDASDARVVDAKTDRVARSDAARDAGSRDR